MPGCDRGVEHVEVDRDLQRLCLRDGLANHFAGAALGTSRLVAQPPPELSHPVHLDALDIANPERGDRAHERQLRQPPQLARARETCAIQFVHEIGVRVDVHDIQLAERLQSHWLDGVPMTDDAPRARSIGQTEPMIASPRPEVLRYAAFTEDPRGGNPAGVVLDALGVDDATMLGTAARVGYSETAFVIARDVRAGELDVRYFSPEAEVPFCGHATIATTVAWAERHGTGLLHMHTPAGLVEVDTTDAPTGLTATLTSVPPKVAPMEPEQLAELLAALRWRADELEPMLPRASLTPASTTRLSQRRRESASRNLTTTLIAYAC